MTGFTVADAVALLLALVVLGTAVAVVTLRNLFHCALLLGLSFFAVAGLYLMLQAEFLAVAQVLVYVGAITLLILFAVMLTQRVAGEPVTLGNRQKLLSAMACIALFSSVLSMEMATPWRVTGALVAQAAPTGGAAPGLTWDLGTQLLTSYLIPFEVASVLLLAALVGAIVLAKEDRV
ncbi:MAG TPA: NADH-quinone oxidoreductase subunit J [Armatimonadota bacterium]